MDELCEHARITLYQTPITSSIRHIAKSELLSFVEHKFVDQRDQLKGLRFGMFLRNEVKIRDSAVYSENQNN